MPESVGWSRGHCAALVWLTYKAVFVFTSVFQAGTRDCDVSEGKKTREIRCRGVEKTTMNWMRATIKGRLVARIAHSWRRRRRWIEVRKKAWTRISTSSCLGPGQPALTSGSSGSGPRRPGRRLLASHSITANYSKPGINCSCRRLGDMKELRIERRKYPSLHRGSFLSWQRCEQLRDLLTARL
jgi:hypothetical protein